MYFRLFYCSIQFTTKKNINKQDFANTTAQHILTLGICLYKTLTPSHIASNQRVLYERTSYFVCLNCSKYKMFVEVKFVWDYSKPQEPRCPPPPRKQTSHRKPSHHPDWGGCRGVSTETPPSSRRMRTRLIPQTPIPPLPKTLTRSSPKSTKSLSQSFPVDPGKLRLRLSRRHLWPLPSRRERLVDLHLEISLYKMKLGCDIRLSEWMAGILCTSSRLHLHPRVPSSHLRQPECFTVCYPPHIGVFVYFSFRAMYFYINTVLFVENLLALINSCAL